MNFSHSRSLSSLVIFDGAAIQPRLTHAWARRFFLRWPFQIGLELVTPSSGKRRKLLYSPALSFFFYPPTGAFFKEQMETAFSVRAGRERRKITNFRIMPDTSLLLKMAPQLHSFNCTPISRFAFCDVPIHPHDAQ
jgi:hypothetical protein